MRATHNGWAHVHARHRDIVGERFGMLIVLGRVPSESKNTRWACQCDCGNRCEVQRTSLVSGATIACGCRMNRQPSHVPIGLPRRRKLRVSTRWRTIFSTLAGARLPRPSKAPGRVHRIWDDEP